MSYLALNNRAKKVSSVLSGIDKGSGFQATTHLYLLKLASVHPTPVGFEELVEDLGLSKGQVSRVTRGLHKIDSKGAPGADLIDITFDLHNPRVKLVTLNERGLKMIEDSLKSI